MQNLNTTINPASRGFTPDDSVTRTMSSREIAKLTGKRHTNVKRDVLTMLADLKANVLSFEHIYLDGRGRRQTEYLLDREHTDCLLTGYSAALRMKVIRRWRELEQQEASRVAVTSNGTKVIGEIAIMECFTRLLKPAPSSQILMLAKIAENNGLEPSFLPAYAIDAAPDAGDGGGSMPTKPLTELLKLHGIKCAAAPFNWKLRDAGIIKQMSRVNAKRETVHFWAVTEKGQRYGKNLTSPHSPRETQPHWYVERFAELVRIVAGGAA